MSDKLEDLIVKLKNLPEFVSGAATNTIEEGEQDILDLNRAQMLVLGVDNEDKQLGTYSEIWADERAEKGLQTEYIELRYTGKFQDEMKLKKTEELSYDFTSDDPKWEQSIDGQKSLQEKWPDALGLDEDNEERLTKLLGDSIGLQVDKFLSTDFPINKLVNV